MVSFGESELDVIKQHLKSKTNKNQINKIKGNNKGR
jgi:hypothetical protein